MPGLPPFIPVSARMKTIRREGSGSRTLWSGDVPVDVSAGRRPEHSANLRQGRVAERTARKGKSAAADQSGLQTVRSRSNPKQVARSSSKHPAIQRSAPRLQLNDDAGHMPHHHEGRIEARAIRIRHADPAICLPRPFNTPESAGRAIDWQFCSSWLRSNKGVAGHPNDLEWRTGQKGEGLPTFLTTGAGSGIGRAVAKEARRRATGYVSLTGASTPMIPSQRPCIGRRLLLRATLRMLNPAERPWQGRQQCSEN